MPHPVTGEQLPTGALSEGSLPPERSKKLKTLVHQRLQRASNMFSSDWDGSRH